MNAVLFWGAAIGGLLLLGLVPALVVTSLFIKPPDDDEPTPSMTDPL